MLWREHPKACEIHQGDQSLLNAEYVGAWHQLPESLLGIAHGNVAIRAQLAFNRSALEARDPAIIHFVGEPKPWEVVKPEKLRLGTNGLWRDLCIVR